MAHWGVGDPSVHAVGLTEQKPRSPMREVTLVQRKTTPIGIGLGKTSGWAHRAVLKQSKVARCRGTSGYCPGASEGGVLGTAKPEGLVLRKEPDPRSVGVSGCYLVPEAFPWRRRRSPAAILSARSAILSSSSLGPYSSSRSATVCLNSMPAGARAFREAPRTPGRARIAARPGLDMLGAGLIGRSLQRAEQEVQSTSPVGAHLRKLARRLRQFLLAARTRRLRLRILRQCRNRQRGHRRGEQDCKGAAWAWESQCHRQSLDAAKRACKAASRQRPVIAGNFSKARQRNGRATAGTRPDTDLNQPLINPGAP